MQNPIKKYHTPEEYLALEENAEYKSEYYAGEIFNMAGASYRHNCIVTNILSVVSGKLLNSGCRILGLDLRLWAAEKELFTYPDAMILCGEPQFYEGRNDTVLNPRVIFEVLSESTKNYDRGEKFAMYRSIPSLQEYVLAEQDSAHVERFVKTEQSDWLFTEWNALDDRVALRSTDCDFTLSDVYRGVSFDDNETEASATEERT